MNNVKVQTTQNVEINYEIASLGDRILAALIDYGVLIAYMLTISVIVYVLNQLDMQDDWLLIPLMILYLVIIFYDLLCEMLMDGQSVGKKVMKIKVIKLDGTQPSFGSYFMRWILRIVDIVLFSPAVAMLVILINGRGQRLGDIAANTTVVKLTERIKFSETLFEEVDRQHNITYHEVSQLNDRDIETLKEVLQTTEKLEQAQAQKLQERTKQVLEQKMSIKVTQPAREFLETIVKDYNAYKGRLA
jgi:uncharacterized RDD family membrane protein YckC